MVVIATTTQAFARTADWRWARAFPGFAALDNLNSTRTPRSAAIVSDQGVCYRGRETSRPTRYAVTTRSDTLRRDSGARSKEAAWTFFHPDYTVGSGVSPDRGNCSLSESLTARLAQTIPRGLYRRSGIGLNLSPHPAPKVANRHSRYSMTRVESSSARPPPHAERRRSAWRFWVVPL